MKILLTGASGFIGSHIRERYESLGHEVIGIDKVGEGSLKIDLVSWSSEMLSYLVQGVDVVNHHAAQVDVRKSLVDPSNDAENNVLVTIKLLEACAKAGVKRFIFASSGGAIADGNPISPYGIAKLSSEHYIRFFAQQYGLETPILRYSNVYGPRQRSGVIPAIIKSIQSGNPFTINGDGQQTRDYVYVSDVAEANVLALDCPSGIYNISTGTTTSLIDLSKKVPIPFQSIHVPAIPGEIRDSILTPSGPLNWNPSISLEEGLRLTFEYCKAIY